MSRVCAADGCDTRLSRYNRDQFCHACQDKDRDLPLATRRTEKRGGGIPGRGRHTRKECIEAIQAWVAEHGRVPKRDEWDRVPYYSYMRLMFGSWNKAIEAAGFTPRRHGGQVLRDRRETLLACLPCTTSEAANASGYSAKYVAKMMSEWHRQGIVVGVPAGDPAKPNAYIWHLAEQQREAA